MALVLFGLWMLLEGRWTVETVLTGIVLSTLVYLFCWKFLDYSPRREWAVIRRFPRAVGYLFWLIGQIFVSGFMTISRIWSGREVRPHLVSFRSALRTDPGRVLLSQSITLTPGTLTVDQRNGRFLVHALDDAYTEGLQDSEMEKRILELEKK
jgi:multicomponent Na+:H+ antiporter subunit E